MKIRTIAVFDEVRITELNDTNKITLNGVELVPLKIGKWIKHDTGHSMFYDCSLCSGLAKCIELADLTVWNLSKFCPDCGARMEGEVDGKND